MSTARELELTRVILEYRPLIEMARERGFDRVVERLAELQAEAAYERFRLQRSRLRQQQYRRRWQPLFKGPHRPMPRRRRTARRALSARADPPAPEPPPDLLALPPLTIAFRHPVEGWTFVAVSLAYALGVEWEGTA